VLLYTVERGIATITLDSPQNRNALSAQLVSALFDRLDEVAADEGVRAVVLTHTGNTFCSGADLTEAPEQGTGRLLSLLRRILELPKPVVAVLNGHARAGGLGLLGACDVVLAGPRCTFAFSEVRLGLAPAVISLTTLPRLSGRAAGRYYLTGEVFDAAQAARIGLVTEAVDDPGKARDEVLDALRKTSPQGLAESKKLTTAAVLHSFDTDGEAVAALSGRLFASEEAREGMESFRQRRPPRWEL
jgi:enoyl-CoA hydratase/carnithine racemase